MEGGAESIRALLVTVVKAKKAKVKVWSVVSLKAQGGTCLPIPAPSDCQRSMILTVLGLSPLHPLSIFLWPFLYPASVQIFFL